MITGRQIREARGLLGINRSNLAKKVGNITTRVVMRAEEDEDAPVDPQANAIAIRRALERAGIEFLPENGGVRLRDSDA